MNDVNNRIFKEFTELASDFSTIMKDLVEYDFILAESIMKERMQSA